MKRVFWGVEAKIFYLLVHFSDGSISQGWAGGKLKVMLVGGRVLNTLAIYCCFFMCVSRELDGK